MSIIRILKILDNTIHYSTVGLPEGFVEIPDDSKLYKYDSVSNSGIEDIETESLNKKILTIITNLNTLYNSWNKGLQLYFKVPYNEIVSLVNGNDINNAIEIVQTYPLPNNNYETYVKEILSILGVSTIES